MYKLKLIKTHLIDDQGIASYKLHINSNTINAKNWGAEILDNAEEYNSSIVEIEVVGRWDNTLNSIKLLTIQNNGDWLSEEDAMDRFIKYPDKPYEYPNNGNGCKGAGKKKEEGKAYIPKTYFAHPDGFVRLLKKTPCYDVDGKDEAVLENLTQEDYNNFIACDKVELYKTDIKNEDIFDNGKGIKMHFYFWGDSEFQLQSYLLKQLAWTRYSNVKNFQINFKDVNGDVEHHKKAYFRMLDEHDNLICDYTELKKIDKIMNVKVPNKNDVIPFQLYYGYSLSPSHDKDKYDIWSKKYKTGIEFRHPYLPNSADVPVLNLLGVDDVILAAYARNFFWSSGFKDYTGLNVFAKPLVDIRRFVSSDKSDGFTETTRTAFCGEVRKTFRDLKLKSPHHDASKKLETLEVQQFINRMTGENRDLRNCFKLLVPYYNENQLKDKTCWIPPGTLLDREIDLRNEYRYEGVDYVDLWEFQPSNEISDNYHLDGINSRIDILCLNDNTKYRNYYWVAKKHTKFSKIKELLISVSDSFKNTVFENIFFLTYDDTVNGFDEDKIMKLNIEKDILKKS